MFLIPWFFMVIFWIADEIVVTLLLKREYTTARSAWTRDGKPSGMFWIPQEARLGKSVASYASRHAALVLRFKWLFQAPQWTNEVSDGPLLMLLHRVFLPAGLICALAPFVIAFVIQQLG